MNRKRWAFIAATLLLAALACSSETAPSKDGDHDVTSVEVCGAAVLPLAALALRWLT